MSNRATGTFEEKRRAGWEKWWKKQGSSSLPVSFRRKSCLLPKKDKKLAEFVGVMIGDGGITPRQIMVSLGSESDKAYIGFVQTLIEDLFGVQAKIYQRTSKCVVITVSRSDISDFCVSIGLKMGNKLKEHLDIPKWAKNSRDFIKACLRGIMDTDGCIFAEVHKYKGKEYAYPRLSIVSHSQKLRDDIFVHLKEMRYSPKIRNNRSVNLEKKEDILRYFKEIGTSNQKHEGRFKKILERCSSGLREQS